MAKRQRSATALADNGLTNVSDYRFPEATRNNDQTKGKHTAANVALPGFVRAGLNRAVRGGL
jgi:hypothetical protein